MAETMTLEAIDAKLAEFKAALDDACLTPSGAVGSTNVVIDAAYIQRLRDRIDDYTRQRNTILNGGVALPTIRGC